MAEVLCVVTGTRRVAGQWETRFRAPQILDRWAAGNLAVRRPGSACSSEDAASDVRTAGSAEVGKALQGERWTITLVAQLELEKALGSGTAV